MANHASITDLQDGAVTIEGWFNISATQPDLTCTLFDKGHFSTGCGVLIYVAATGVITAKVNCATTDADTTLIGDVRGSWLHIAAQFDDAGDRKLYFALNGVWQAYAAQTAGVGAIVTDNGRAQKIGVREDGANWRMAGNIGWVRFSNVLSYTVGSNFTPAARGAPPSVDANAVRLLKVNEGTGTALVDYSANAQNASQAGGTWVRG
jgi:hypothetical protein